MSTNRLMAVWLGPELNRQGRTRRWLARRVGVDPSLITRYCQLARPVPGERAEAIAAHLGVDLGVIFDVRSGTSSVRDRAGGYQ